MEEKKVEYFEAISESDGRKYQVRIHGPDPIPKDILNRVNYDVSNTNLGNFIKSEEGIKPPMSLERKSSEVGEHF